jgi:hypothetical protein
MSNRSVKFAPALLAGVVAGASLATVTDLRAQVIATAAEAATPATQAAADSCLSAPKGATPSGSHWYYRIDRVTKRQCWYLREESDTADDKFARAAPPASAPASAAEEPASPQQRTITRQSIADARAEWISQQPRAEPAKVERTAAAAPLHSCRIARAQPCRTCSRRRRCRDAMERRSHHEISGNPTGLRSKPRTHR